ncbi:MAG: peptidase S24 [Saprospirales bacterium]|nr:MAG: peptidase S24 [Saprospirales bacterium]
MNHAVSKRFVQSLKKLKEKGVIKSFRQFAISVDYLPQSLSEVVNGRRDVTIDLLYKSIGEYQLNPSYLFAGKGDMICKNGNGNFRELTIVSDQHGRENIVHVPVPAQAGYASGMPLQVLKEELPVYSLPDYQYKMGTYRSFDVCGDSMLPILKSGDQVICQFVEPEYWKHSIKDGKVYVVVTLDDVLVKRVTNKILSDGMIEVHSDNRHFLTYEIDIEEIREIWLVKTVISAFDHAGAEENEDKRQIEQLKELIDRQSRLLKMYESANKMAGAVR